ncbi:MAG: ferritin family protein [candidate division Zixibacteria bacterium]
MKESTQQALDVLSKGINTELAAYVFYKRASEKIDNREIIDLLEKLAAEEKDHYWTLEAEYDSLVRSEKWVTYNDIMRKTGLPEIPEEMAENHQKRLDALNTVINEVSILKMALELEEEARDLYQSQVDNVDDPVAREMYTFLAKIEQGHINVINNWIRKLG